MVNWFTWALWEGPLRGFGMSLPVLKVVKNLVATLSIWQAPSSRWKQASLLLKYVTRWTFETAVRQLPCFYGLQGHVSPFVRFWRVGTDTVVPCINDWPDLSELNWVTDLVVCPILVCHITWYLGLTVLVRASRAVIASHWQLLTLIIMVESLDPGPLDLESDLVQIAWYLHPNLNCWTIPRIKEQGPFLPHIRWSTARRKDYQWDSLA